MLRSINLTITTGVLLVLAIAASGLNAQVFEVGFEQENGPVENWTIHSGNWEVVDEALVGSSAGGETWSWAGSPAQEFPPTFELTFEMDFLDTPPDGIGRHGGIMFCATVPTQRYDAATSGYELDWIDRQSDHGLRLIRVDNGRHIMLGTGGANLFDPPVDWRIVVDSDRIEVWGDDELLIEAQDGTHRGGHIGFWGWQNNQRIAYDNIMVDSGEVFLRPCFSSDPEGGPAPLEVNFDAGCSTSDQEIESYLWDFGDGQTAEGPQATHLYEIADNYVVTLEVTTTNGESAFVEKSVNVFDVIDYYEEFFDLGDGPPADWNILSGNWIVQNEALNIATSGGGESWAWIGAGPARFGNVWSVTFRLTFHNNPADGIGRHGGVFIFAQNSQPRFAGNSGYSVDWIDRPADRGYRISVWNNGRETPLVSGTGDVEPGEEWTIAFDDNAIQLLVDGDFKAEVIDPTYRSGHVGFWSYHNNQDFSIDDIIIGEDGGGGVEICDNDRDDDGDGAIDCDDTDCADQALCVPAEICDNVIDDDRDGDADCDDTDCADEAACAEPAGPRIVRGDSNSDGSINLTDGVIPLLYLFSGGDAPACMDSADANDTGAIEITDAIIIFGWLFTGGNAPAPPGPTSPGYLSSDCGEDLSEDTIGCARSALICQ
ncbi:MAG: PKD domain-containing protein [Planctomycetota bacterium]|nr:PKD domain-containing protein [Planctomycetota bacterium]